MQLRWNPIFISVLIVGTILILGSAVFSLEQRVAMLSNQLGELEKRLSTPQVSQTEVNQIREHLERSLISQENQFKVQLEQTHQAILKHIQELNETSKTTLSDFAQKKLENYLKLKTQVENSQTVLETLLGTVKHNGVLTHTAVPPGVVMAYAGPLTVAGQQELSKAGWLICDGRELSTDQYSALYQAIQNTYGGQTPKTFKLPDFRGVFLRGLDLEKQLDPQRQLGSYQEDTNQAHVHEAQITMGGLHEHKGTTDETGKHRHRLEAQGYWFTSKLQNERAAITNAVDDNQQYWTTLDGLHSHTFQTTTNGEHNHTLEMKTSGGGQEARPKNYAVVYIIKF